MNDINESVNEELEQNKKSSASQEEIEQLLKDLEAYKQRLARTQADMDNQRKRMEREIESAKMFAIQDFVIKLLPAKDSMEKGLEHAEEEQVLDSETLLEGMKATLMLCNGVFRNAGLEEINPVGKTFDPELHEAMSIREVQDAEPNQILTVFQKGCILNGRLIRPARVEVSTNN